MTTWMLVEDEPDLYDMVLAMYSMIGVKGEAFPDGEQALEWIEKVDAGSIDSELPELCLLDIRLPGKFSGLDVGERLRKSPKLKDMVIVLITTYHMTPHEERAAISQTQADALIYKPLPDFIVFRKQLEDLLKKRGKRIEAQEPETRPSTNGSKASTQTASEVPSEIIDDLLESIADPRDEESGTLGDLMGTLGNIDDDDLDNLLEYLSDDDEDEFDDDDDDSEVFSTAGDAASGDTGDKVDDKQDVTAENQVGPSPRADAETDEGEEDEKSGVGAGSADNDADKSDDEADNSQNDVTDTADSSDTPDDRKSD